MADPLRREPNPRRLLLVLLTVAFLGDSCAIQQAIGPVGERPSEEDLKQRLSDFGQLPADPDAARQVAAANIAVFEEELRTAERFRPFTTVFGLLLVAAYTFVMVFGMRALRFAPGSAQGLARAAIAVLPARVAVAAVDLASARAVQPAMREMALAFVRTQKSGLPADQLADMERVIGTLAPWASVAFSLGMALGVCLLFHQASRYFQRPDVLALFEKRGGPPPEPD